LLWAYGGVWIDMDSLLTRDLEPLLEHEFVTQWDCYGKSHWVYFSAMIL
jgi:mannosyltransferase OCH1-like enzyme